MSELIKSDNEYKKWISNMSHEYKRSQIKAAVKVNEEMLKKAKMVSNEMFPIDCHLYIISAPEGIIEIEVEDRLGFMGTSSSGDLKCLNSIIKDIYIYYGVSQEDIDRKTPRYQTLESALSM